jgi:hypothetical protein
LPFFEALEGKTLTVSKGLIALNITCQPESVAPEGSALQIVTLETIFLLVKVQVTCSPPSRLHLAQAVGGLPHYYYLHNLFYQCHPLTGSSVMIKHS